jgi:selenocysteine lyase/cysteine desulfurase
MERLGIDGSIRASIGLYNSKADIDQFINALKKAYKFLG